MTYGLILPNHFFLLSFPSLLVKMTTAHSPSKTLLGLKVLSQLRNNEKLGLVDGMPQVYKQGRMQWFWRWWDKQNYEIAVSAAEKWVVEAYEEIQIAMEKEEDFVMSGEVEKPSSRKKYVEREENLQYIQHYLTALIDAKLGLEDMKETYSYDSTLRSRLTMLLLSIDDKVMLVNKALKFLDREKKQTPPS